MRRHIGPVAHLVWALSTALPSGALADFTYHRTEYSIEWLTDASSAIALGEVTSYARSGRFAFRIQGVLKLAGGMKLGAGDVIEGEKLGRSWRDDSQRDPMNFSVGGDATSLAPELGRPVCSEPGTYPPCRRPTSPAALPRPRPWGTWERGNRGILFFGPSVRNVFHAIELDHCEYAEGLRNPEYLAVDLHGKILRDPDKLIGRIEQRVAEGRRGSSDGSARVCSYGFYYWPRGCELEDESYYYVFVPPDAGFRPMIERFLGDRRQFRTGRPLQPGELVPRSDRSLMVWYWFYSNKREEEFAADQQKEFFAALQALDSKRTELAMVPRASRANSQIRDRYVTNRSYPLGWRCALSPDARSYAYLDANFAYLYDLPQADAGAANRILRLDTVDCRSGELSFSASGDLFSVVEADGGPFVYDVRARRQIWKGKLPLECDEQVACTQLCFSVDGKYLLQSVCTVWPSGAPNPQDTQVVAWEVATGRCVFRPYGQWQRGLRIVHLHHRDSRFVRLTLPRGARSAKGETGDVIWNMETGKTVSPASCGDEWDPCD